MPVISRRMVAGGLAFGAGGLFASATCAAGFEDGHAAGFDVAPAPNPMALVPRRSGDPVVFTASLDKAPLKAVSGGWAREVTSRTLPIATALAGAHLFLNPGGSREMHWHDSDEWAYVLNGDGQITALDAAGKMEVVNVAAGDLWYFPRGHPHAIHSLGERPMHAILVFNDGLYSEHGTFGITDWMSRIDPTELARAIGVAPAQLEGMPKGETYIMQGPIVPIDGPQARDERPWPASRSHRYRLGGALPVLETPAGMVKQASQTEFPISNAMTGSIIRLQPSAMQQLHWHPSANEWLYVARGSIRMSLFAPDKRLAVANISAGECAYVPANCGHHVCNVGSESCELVSVLDNKSYEEVLLSDWLHKAPRHLLSNNLGFKETDLPDFPHVEPLVPSRG